MHTVRLPPFELLYVEHGEEILRYLRRLSGAAGAEDAFQETFLRALRAYPRLRSSRNLRAWLYAIATHVAIDEHRRRRPSAPLPDLPDPTDTDSRPPYAELEHLTNGLPPTERAAVVLRFGYDLSYTDIATVLGSSEEAARQAASSGVRRLRKRRET
jgi:RNA polymerase sigma factor (sigma-70 family)